MFIDGLVTGVRVSKKGRKILLVANGKFVHNILMPEEYQDEASPGDHVELEVSATNPMFLFGTDNVTIRRNGKS